jgi:hypothetical protein
VRILDQVDPETPFSPQEYNDLPLRTGPSDNSNRHGACVEHLIKIVPGMPIFYLLLYQRLTV